MSFQDHTPSPCDCNLTWLSPNQCWYYRDDCSMPKCHLPIVYMKNLCFLIFAHASTKVFVITFTLCTQNILGSDNTHVSFIVYEVHDAIALRKYVHELFSLVCHVRQVSCHFHFRQASFGFDWYILFVMIFIIYNFTFYAL